jgi:hypothetical protein
MISSPMINPPMVTRTSKAHAHRQRSMRFFPSRLLFAAFCFAATHGAEVCLAEDLLQSNFQDAGDVSIEKWKIPAGYRIGETDRGIRGLVCEKSDAPGWTKCYAEIPNVTSVKASSLTLAFDVSLEGYYTAGRGWLCDGNGNGYGLEVRGLQGTNGAVAISLFSWKEGSVPLSSGKRLLGTFSLGETNKKSVKQPEGEFITVTLRIEPLPGSPAIRLSAWVNGVAGEPDAPLLSFVDDGQNVFKVDSMQEQTSEPSKASPPLSFLGLQFVALEGNRITEKGTGEPRGYIVFGKAKVSSP